MRQSRYPSPLYAARHREDRAHAAQGPHGQKPPDRRFNKNPGQKGREVPGGQGRKGCYSREEVRIHSYQESLSLRWFVLTP